MILRILNTTSAVLLHFLAATLLAELIIFGYLLSAWELDRDKLMKILAVAQGIDPEPMQVGPTSEDERNAEQASYQEIVERRAAKYRDLELREQALQNAVVQLKADQKQLDESQTKYEQVIQEFTAQLSKLVDGAEAEGRDEVGRILAAMKPAQAKIQLIEMLENDEIDEVVILLSGMQDSKRSKILAEFKDDQENKKVAEVLRLIREGEPKTGIAQGSEQRLGDDLPAGS